MALSAKQQVFVEEYLITWNASEAARRAGYSEKTAGAIGHENLTKPEIAEEIARRVSDKAMTADEVLIRLAEQARSEQSRYLTSEGINLEMLIADGRAHLVKGIKETKYGREIEFYDAQAALVHIGKHHKLFTDNIEHSGSVDLIVKGYVTVTPDDWDKDTDDSNV